jgi:hypothetical protein
MLIKAPWHFGKPDKQKLQISIPCDNPQKSHHNHTRHSSTKRKANQKDHHDIGIMILNLKLCRRHCDIHVLLHFLVLGHQLIEAFSQVMDERHVRMWTESHDQPCKPQLVADINVPVVLWNLVVCEEGSVHFHSNIVDKLGNDLLELDTEKVGLQQKSNHHCSYDVNDD